MPDKMIKKLSRKLNRNSYLRSFSIVLCRFSVLAVFSMIPVLLLKAVETSGMKNSLNDFNTMFYPALLAVVFLFVFIGLQIILSSFSMGENAWYTGRLTRKKLCGKRLRFWFRTSLSLKAFRLYALLFVIKLLWTTALISPALLMYSAIIVTALTGGIEIYLFISLAVGGTVLLITGLIFRFIILQRYFLAPYLLAEEPKLKPFQAIKQSKNLLEGRIYKIVSFKLKFMPAFLLYVFILPIIFFHPHYKQCCSVIAKEIRL